jgi:hypothetical protein
MISRPPRTGCSQAVPRQRPLESRFPTTAKVGWRGLSLDHSFRWLDKPEILITPTYR